MEIEVVSRRDNPLLKRTEVRFRVRHPKESTPARDALRRALAEELKATKDIVVVSRARSVFGRAESEGFAKVYKTKEDAFRTEREHILVRNRLKEAVVKVKKAAPPKPAPTRPAAPAAKEEAKPAAKPAEKAAAAKKEPEKPEPPAKKEAGKKDEKPPEKKPTKGA